MARSKKGIETSHFLNRLFLVLRIINFTMVQDCLIMPLYFDIFNMLLFYIRREETGDNAEKHFSETPIRLYMPGHLDDTNIEASDADIATRSYETLAYCVEEDEPPRKRPHLVLRRSKSISSTSSTTDSPPTSWETTELQSTSVSSSEENQPEPPAEDFKKPYSPLGLKLRSVNDLKAGLIPTSSAVDVHVPYYPDTGATCTLTLPELFKPTYKPSMPILDEPYSPTMPPLELISDWGPLPDGCRPSWAEDITGVGADHANNINMVD